MDDNGNIAYYLVLGAIYLLSRIFGKKKKKPGQPQPTKERNIAPPTAENEGGEPISFEDILRELSGDKKPKPVEEPVLELGPVHAEDTKSVFERTETIQPGSYSVDEIDEIAVEYDVPDPIGYDSANPTEPIVRKKLTFSRNEHFKLEEKETIDYLEDLYKENGPAKAFIMSEIFARKY